MEVMWPRRVYNETHDEKNIEDIVGIKVVDVDELTVMGLLVT